MSVTDLITSKLQTLLGNKYSLFSISHFNKHYTESKLVNDGGNIGYYRVNNSDYGKFRKDKIVGVFSLNNAIRSNVAYYYLSANYEIEFSVPRNVEKVNSKDVLVETAPFDFEGDIETLIGNIINTKITLSTTPNRYAKMTMSEPQYVATEVDGEYYYDIMSVNGAIVITDIANFGGDYKVELEIDGNYVEIDDIIRYNETYDVNSNAIQKQGKVRTEQNPSASGYVVTFDIEDVQTTNSARLYLMNILHNNLEIISPLETSEKLKREVKARTTAPDNSTHEFNAILGMTLQTSRNSVGTIAVTLTDDGA